MPHQVQPSKMIIVRWKGVAHGQGRGIPLEFFDKLQFDIWPELSIRLIRKRWPKDSRRQFAERTIVAAEPTLRQSGRDFDNMLDIGDSRDLPGLR
jgi:hypothetical protein